MPESPEFILPAEFDPKNELWGSVTDPSTHNPNKYQYLVHAINTKSKLGEILIQEFEKASLGIQEEISNGDQTINLLESPEALDQRVALSCSLINQDHRVTYGYVGLIIGAPKNNIVITSPTDAGARVWHRQSLIERSEKSTILSPDELLTETTPGDLNEVVVLAKNEGRKVSLLGFFYIMDENEIPKDQDLFSTFSKHSERLNLPILPIMECGIEFDSAEAAFLKLLNKQ